MDRRKNLGTKKYIPGRIWICALLISISAGTACSGFGIGGVVPNDQPLTAAFPANTAPEYGKFVLYHVGEGQIKTLMFEENIYLVTYHVGDLPYRPSMKSPSDEQLNYNIQHPCGDGYTNANPPVRDMDQTIFYKDYVNNCGRDLRSASDHPEAVVVNNKLFFYYTNYPMTTKDFNGNDVFLCKSSGGIVDGLNNDFSDVPNDPNQDFSTLTGTNCYFKDKIEPRVSPGYDLDWVLIPVSQFGLNRIIPLKLRVMGDQFNMKGARILRLSLYETASGGVPDPSTEKPVSSSRFGIDLSRGLDPMVGYMARPNRDYWLLITDWEAKKGIAQTMEYDFIVMVESAPMVGIPWDPTSVIYRAGIMPAKSGNPDLNNGPSFEPDDVSTLVRDIYPDCDGVPDTGDEGDWGIYEICPVEGGGVSDPEDTLGIQDGNMQYWEVDDKDHIDDGEYFRGVKTNIPSLGNEAPSVIQIGNQLWMFISTGSGIFQLSSLDRLTGLEWSLKNIYEDRPSLLPRSKDEDAPGEPNAPVVSSGRYGYCETKAEGDDTQVAVPGRGYPNSVCTTFGDDGSLDSTALVDEESANSGNPGINSGPDGVINTYYFPKCVSYREPVFPAYYQLKTEAPGNPDLNCGDSVSGAKDETAYLLGDDQWATAAIGLNPPEYWRNQNCNPLSMADQFNQCALGGKSNAGAISAGGDGQLQTATDFLSGDDYFCHQGDRVGICPGKNKKFDQGRTEELLRKIKKVPVNDDELCEINPAAGLEWARFKYANSVPLNHRQIVPGSEILVSFYISIYNFLGGGPVASEILVNGTDYDINYDTGELTMLGNNWLGALAGNGYDPVFFGDPNNRLKDNLMVYYRYQGAQIGVCPGPDSIIDTPRYFLASPIFPDHIIKGPTMELSPSMSAAFGGASQFDLAEPGDTYVDNINWDFGQLAFVCAGGDCPIAPGSDNSLDGAWVLDSSLAWTTFQTLNGTYAWPPFPPANMPYVKPNHFDLSGQFDDWLCPINGELALCPGGNGYFQIYQLWQKVKVSEYDGIDDLMFNYKKSDNPCYILETNDDQDGFFETPVTKYIQYSYRGVMGDDQVVWNDRLNQYQVSTGTNGINQSCSNPSDNQTIPRYQGMRYQRIIEPGSNGKLESDAMKDELYFEELENERPIPKIRSGSDGICNSYRIGDDRVEIFFGTGAPDYACVEAGPNGYANTNAQGNDSQLYLPGEKTGFDAFQVDTPEVAKDHDKLYLYYSGLGWLNAPKSVPPGRGALASIGECKRPGLDNRWGNLDYGWSTSPQFVTPRSFINTSGSLSVATISALDDNQGVILAPRIGVATSSIDRINQDPRDWDRVLQPAVDVGGICQNMISGDLLSIVGGLMGGDLGSTSDTPFPPVFNYAGSFSPDIFIKYNESDDQPIFIMFLNGIYSIKSSGVYGSDAFNAGLIKPAYQIGMARSIDGIHFDLANDINPLIVLGNLNEDLDAALGTTMFSGKDRASFMNPTVFESADDSFSMLMKNIYPSNIDEAGTAIGKLSLTLKSKQEWLGVAFRSGSVFSGGLAGLISCRINPRQMESSQNLFKIGTGALLLLPLAGLILIRLWGRKARKR